MKEPDLQVEWTYNVVDNNRHTLSEAEAKVSVSVEYRLYKTEHKYAQYPCDGSKIPAVSQRAIVPGEL